MTTTSSFDRVWGVNSKRASIQEGRGIQSAWSEVEDRSCVPSFRALPASEWELSASLAERAKQGAWCVAKMLSVCAP